MQLAWVTADLDRSLAQFRTLYGIPEFLVMEQKFPAEVFGETGEMHVRLALANVDNIQFELIEPLGGGVDSIYRDVLPRDGRHTNVFHHFCVKVQGDLSDWEAHVAAFGPQRPIAYVGDVGPDARFVYTDERPTVGAYVEHVWFGPELDAQMAAAIPTYRTR
jgi:hypothetical protein